MEVPFFFRRLWPLSAVRCPRPFGPPLSAGLCLLSASLAVAGGASAADGPAGVGGPLVPDVRRVILPERLSRGNTGVEPLSPIDRAAWLAPADAAIPPGGLFLRFRRPFEADGATPLRFHVSADERFVLLLDGAVVARGPDRGDPRMWFFQSYETVPSAGRHVFDAVVWKLSPGQAPNAQLSWRLGFAFAAEGPFEAALTTGTAGWTVGRLVGTRMTDGKYPAGPVGAQCDVRGCGLLAEEPTRWERPVVVRGPVVPNAARSRRTPGWLLYPSQLPAQVARTLRPGAFRAADGQAFDTNGVWSAVARDVCSNGWYRADAAAHPAVAGANALLRGGRRLVVPARTRLRLLWDLGDYVCAYPDLAVSGGAGARVAWGWAESLYTGDAFDWHTVVEGKERKGRTSRAAWADKYFYGNADVFRPDGRAGARFTTPWWRCGRWCQLEVETADAPLSLDALSLAETRYPLEAEGYFRCDDPTVADVWRLCVRGLQMCAHEMHFDCPYYEQQMYGGDTRIQMLVTDALTADDRLMRQAFRLFEISQRDDGAVSMNYPTAWLQESSTFSLYWAMMPGDYALWHGDAAWLRARMPAVRRWLSSVEGLVGADGLVRGLPGWNFVDWVPSWTFGVPPGGGPGEAGSSIHNLLCLLAFRKAAAVEAHLGEAELAARGRRHADALAAAIARTFWSESRGLLADTPAKDSFSEHAQALAILSGALDAPRAARARDGLVSAPDLARCTVSFSHYLFGALARGGRTDVLLKRLDLWRDMVRQDLKTPLEGPGDARSDCHAWGSHPAYHLLTGVAGIRPDAAGFARVRVAPQPGGLRRIEAGVPSPRGLVRADLRFDGGRVAGTVTLPEGLPGVFAWQGVETPLSPGANRIAR